MLLKMARYLNTLAFCSCSSKQMKKMLLLMIEKRDSARRFWSNATFSFLLDKFEKRNWELGKKLMKKQNWEDFATIVNIHF